MRLLVVSHTPHYRRDGELVGWGSTVRELDQLATRFADVRHVAALHDEPAPANAVAYRARNIELVAVPPSGGDGLRAKLGVVEAGRVYLETIARELARADMVHVRAPASIALIAIALLATRRQPQLRWFKYAGSWRPQGFDHITYAVQRWLLRSHLAGGVVTVNGDRGPAPRWLMSMYNPSLDGETLGRGRVAAREKRLGKPLRLVFVGRVDAEKGAPRAIAIVERCTDLGLDVELDMIGDGPARAELERHARARDLRCRFWGWLPPDQVLERFRDVHVSLLPSRTEGWPKVLSEAMAFGVVPVASRVGAIPSYLERWRLGAAIEVEAIDDYVAALTTYVHQPERWAEESRRAVELAELFGFDHYLAEVDAIVREARACAS